jgi:hypothetical protein
MRVKEIRPWELVEGPWGLYHQGQLHDPAPRGEGKEEIRLIDLPGNPTFYTKITIIRKKSRA